MAIETVVDSEIAQHLHKRALETLEGLDLVKEKTYSVASGGLALARNCDASITEANLFEVIKDILESTQLSTELRSCIDRLAALAGSKLGMEEVAHG